MEEAEVERNQGGLTEIHKKDYHSLCRSGHASFAEQIPEQINARGNNVFGLSRRLRVSFLPCDFSCD
jgi:hypothetical protein